MFLSQFGQDLRAAARVIPDETDPGVARDFSHELIGKTLEGRERFLQHDPGNLPMPAGRVLARGALSHAAKTRARLALTAQHSREPERVQIRQSQIRALRQNVPERIGAIVAVFRSVRRMTHAHAVENQNKRAHEEKLEG